MRPQPSVGDLVKAIGGGDKGRVGLVEGFRDQSDGHPTSHRSHRWALVQWTDKPEPSPYTFYVPVQLLRVISGG